MIAVDTNILARFYCDDPDDPEAAKQRPLARDVMIESPAVVKEALDLHRQGFDFADALHWVSSKMCTQFATFDDRRFARRINRLEKMPKVIVPKSA